MNISEVAEWIGIADSTIRKYLREFGDISGAFSGAALPGANKHRRFTDEDVAVLAWIAKQYENRLSPEGIRAALREHVETGTSFELPGQRPDDKAIERDMIPRTQHEEILQANQRALDLALAERDSIRQMLDGERVSHRTERGEWQSEIAKLNREIGRLAQLVRELGKDPGLDD